jgi:C-terminal processing protease CtpA/Prc
MLNHKKIMTIQEINKSITLNDKIKKKKNIKNIDEKKSLDIQAWLQKMQLIKKENLTTEMKRKNKGKQIRVKCENMEYNIDKLDTKLRK